MNSVSPPSQQLIVHVELQPDRGLSLPRLTYQHIRPVSEDGRFHDLAFCTQHRAFNEHDISLSTCAFSQWCFVDIFFIEFLYPVLSGLLFLSSSAIFVYPLQRLRFCKYPFWHLIYCFYCSCSACSITLREGIASGAPSRCAWTCHLVHWIAFSSPDSSDYHGEAIWSHWFVTLIHIVATQHFRYPCVFNVV